MPPPAADGVPLRSEGGAIGGRTGRGHPVLTAHQLNCDPQFAAWLCRRLGRRPSEFDRALAGDDVPDTVPGVIDGGRPVPVKTNLQIVWKDGGRSNFRMKKATPSQIHLAVTGNFIAEYETVARREIPPKAKEALLLFTGRHERQAEILESVPEEFVGDSVRRLERNCHSRLTLASMYGFDTEMAGALLKWLRDERVGLFRFCFATGAAKDDEWAVDFVWYHGESTFDDGDAILDVSAIASKLEDVSGPELEEEVRPSDPGQVGSVIALPFGGLQYHLHSLQFRHDPRKLDALMRRRRKTFGAKQKLSGHENELRIAAELNGNLEFRRHFCERVGRPAEDFSRAEAGGAHARREDGVLGEKTTGKTDVAVLWKDGSFTNVSIKKNPKGQVYLVGAGNFADVYEAQYGEPVPDPVRRALAFFTGENPESRRVLEATDVAVDGERARRVAVESNYRLTFDVLRNHDAAMADGMLEFLRDNMDRVFELSFAAGAVKDRALWSDVLWYKNLVDSEGMGLDYLVAISSVKAALARKRGTLEVRPGPQNAGSTIHLPFGHLQYHLGQLEFYQSLQKIRELSEGGVKGAGR